MSNPKTLLAGPILRNVSPSPTQTSKTNVSVFVASSKPDQIKLDIYEKTGARDAFQSRSSLSNPIATDSFTPLKIGEKVYVVVMSLSAPLRHDVQYYYNVTVGGEDLAQMGLLSGPGCLGYQANVLPSFILPAQNRDDLHFFHSSCRKPHGEGKDALAILDSKIELQVNDPRRRPQQLFLTGDQIYADDVDTFVLSVIMRRGEEYFYNQSSKKEKLGSFEYPSISEKPEVIRSQVDGSNIVKYKDVFLAQRKRFIKRYTGFSSNESHNHLLYAVDFFMMYLLAWSPELWPTKADESLNFDIPELGQSDENDEKYKEYWKRILKSKETKIHNEYVENYFKALPFVRRALANIPTYMIFDDHEVSDDWNIHQKWITSVNESTDGEKVLCNALLAYAIFQDWGNLAPPKDPKKPKYQVQANGEQLRIDDKVNWSMADHNHDFNLIKHLGADAVLTTAEPTHIKWYYRIKFYAHQLIVLDTRTRRDVHPTLRLAEESPPELILKNSLKVQMPEATPATKQLIPILMSPTPVLGLPFIEHLIQPVLVMRTVFNEKLDNESWATSPRAREELLRRLSTYEQAVIVSGDVHYGFSNEASYFNLRNNPKKTSKIIQFCSSSAHNRTDHQAKIAKFVYKDGYHEPSIDFIGYPDRDALGIIKGNFAPDVVNLLAIYISNAHNLRARFTQYLTYKHAPPLVMPKFEGAKRNHGDIKHNAAYPNKWSYRVRYLVDETSPIRKCTPSSSIPERIAGHKNYADFNYPNPIETNTIGENHIGEVTFLGDRVHHNVHRYGNPKLEVSQPLPESANHLNTGITTIVHSASLAIPALSEAPSGF